MLSRIICLLLVPTYLHSFTILLDPAGDSKHPGRSLPNGFERGATLQFASALSKQITQQHPHVTVLISKKAGEPVEALQTANFANNLQVDLVLNLNFYEETSIKPVIFIYYYQNQKIFSTREHLTLDFYPYHNAFMFNFDKTEAYANLMQKWLAQAAYKHYFSCPPALGLPFQPLAGIIAPGIGIEIGLKKNGWEPYLEPILASLSEILCQ